MQIILFHIKHKLLVTFIIFCCMQISGQVIPMISTTWNQGCYYNSDCPATTSGGACGRVWTGCNATAMAQILKYYNFPSTGMGSHCNTNSVSDCVDFSLQTYNYATMPNNVTSSNSEVAKLMYHLGISVDMQWDGTSSNSFFSPVSLKRYFKYSPRMYSTATFMFNSTADLITAIKTELNEGRPVQAKGGNHFYLIDGYNGSDQFHMNFGWGGLYNGYYKIDSVVNGAGTWTPSNFIFNIRPLVGDLETAKDTIFISAAAITNNAIEFTSLLNWNMFTTDPWMTLNLTSGTGGYFGASFSSQTNNGMERYGYIYIQNANDSDTIVVKQDGSPLIVSQNSLNYPAAGGSQNVGISYSWGAWNATSPDPWISLFPSSGTGNGTISVTCQANTNPTQRNGIVIVTGGFFTDTIFVQQQDSLTSTGVFEFAELTSAFLIYPNPSDGKFTINTKIIKGEIFVYNTLGEKVYQSVNSYLPSGGSLITNPPGAGQGAPMTSYLMTIELYDQPEGIYFIKVKTEKEQFTQKIIKQ